jgi:hypothetical protein
VFEVGLEFVCRSVGGFGLERLGGLMLVS